MLAKLPSKLILLEYQAGMERPGTPYESQGSMKEYDAQQTAAFAAQFFKAEHFTIQVIEQK